MLIQPTFKLLPVALAAVLAACATAPEQPAAAASGAATAPKPAAASAAPAAGAAKPAAVPVAAAKPGAAQTPPGAASAPTARAPNAAGATPPAPPPAPGTPPPFATVTKDAKRSSGLISVWTKDDKTWLEIPAEMLGKPMLFSANVTHSVGERGLQGSTMGPSWLVSFVKMGPYHLQLQALNTAYAASGKPQQAALEENFSRSLLAATPMASAPHAESKAVLVDASFLLNDIAQYGRRLEAVYRLPYGNDRGNSHIRSAKASPQQTTVATQMHFVIPRVPLPPLVPIPVPIPPPPGTLPDARSMLIGMQYNFIKLPDAPMQPRQADGRVGHFFDTVTDFSADTKLQMRQRLVNRWRLEKKDPNAVLSEPVKPIVYWLDKNIPQQYRESVKAGVLEWNKAFERIGFKDAIVVKQQADDADFDTLDGVHASVRWYFSNDADSAVGPSHTDPRTGEILDADIRIGNGWARYARGLAVEQTGSSFGSAASQASASENKLAELTAQWRSTGHKPVHQADFCNYANELESEHAFAMEVLMADGSIKPDSPEAEAVVQAIIKDVTTHEVGHTLGLKHNFKASTIYTAAQLADPEFTAANGNASSVMDYYAYNLPLPGEKPARLLNSTIGPYDHWAIEYAYKQVPLAEEAAETERIASRSTEPNLVFADDMDAAGFFGLEGIDPYANRFDLGADPLTFIERRIKLTQNLWKRAAEWKPLPGEGALRQRNMVAAGFSQYRLSSDIAAKYVGGMTVTREVPGTPAAAGRKGTYVPVDGAQQRRALGLVAQSLFSADSFKLPPQLIANLAPDFVDWVPRMAPSVPLAVLVVQTRALDRLMGAGTALRLIETPLFLQPAERAKAVSLSEVYATLQGAIWSELASGADIDPLRRNLQREHLRRVQALLVRPAGLPPDALSLLRYHAQDLQAKLAKAAKAPRLAVESRAHLQDALSGLSEALKASMLRAG